MAAGGQGVTGGRGLVLVFDLDQTLVDTNILGRKLRNVDTLPALNHDLCSIIVRAEKLSREKPGSIDAFLLLTNNDGRDYVSHVCNMIARICPNKGSNFRRVLKVENANIDDTNPLFFDYIMMRSNKHRANMSKSLMDVRIMLSKLGIGYSDLDKRTFFFDDNEHPGMRYDLRTYPEHYIKITSDKPNAGFLKGRPDTTDYSPIMEALSRAENGDEPVPMREAIENQTGGPPGPPPTDPWDRLDGGPGAYYSSGPGAYFIAPAPLAAPVRLKSAGPGATMPKYVAPPKVASTETVTSGTNLSGLGLPKPKAARPSLMGAFAPPGGGRRKTKRRNKKRSTRRR